MKRSRIAYLLAFLLTLAMSSIVGLPAQNASAQPQLTPRPTPRFSGMSGVRDDSGVKVRAPKHQKENCATVKAQAKNLAAQGNHIAACLDEVKSPIRPNGLAEDLFPGSFPSSCRIDSFVIDDRYSGCAVSTFDAVFFELPSGAIIGTAKISLLQYNTLSRGSRSWIHQVKLNMFEATGVALIDSFIEISIHCMPAPQCTTENETPPPNLIPLKLDNPLAGTWVFRSDTNDRFSYATEAQLTIFNLASDTAATGVGGEMFGMRCDNVTAPNFQTIDGGCVYSNWLPFLRLSLSDPDVDESAAHIAAAQATLPDKFGVFTGALTDVPLNRLIDSTVINRNRAASCGKFVPDPSKPDDSCDEYSFASTYQGASIVGPGRFSIEHVDGHDNSLAGSRLGGMYSRNRMLDFDEFFVIIDP